MVHTPITNKHTCHAERLSWSARVCDFAINAHSGTLQREKTFEFMMRSTPDDVKLTNQKYPTAPYSLPVGGERAHETHVRPLRQLPSTVHQERSEYVAATDLSYQLAILDDRKSSYVTRLEEVRHRVDVVIRIDSDRVSCHFIAH